MVIDRRLLLASAAAASVLRPRAARAANTTWNPSDKGAGITLSGLNLIATNNNNAISGVRAIGSQVTGKIYWEVTFNVVTYSFNGCGIINGVISVNQTPQAAPAGTPMVAVQTNGQITGGVISGPNLGVISGGTVVCFAVDCGGQMFWVRSGAAGNWNASGTANPATGAGGVSMTSVNLGGGVAVYPWCELGNTNDRMTANFGDSAFAGVVPAGFTAGFPTTPLGASTPATTGNLSLGIN